jgi:CHAP domain
MKMYHSIVLVLSFVLSPSFHSTIIDVGSKIDTYNGVDVYYNGNDYTHVTGRHVTNDGYNLGLKFQCVEFVKRYYFYVFDHKMPNAFGHAKDFFDKDLPDKSYNKKRGLTQFRNVREYKPAVDDILVYDKSPGNPFGHVAIISYVGDQEIEIVQQNMGLNSRIKIPLVNFQQYWTIADHNILGWLRKEYISKEK